MQVTIRFAASVLLASVLACSTMLAADGSLRVGTAAVNLVADDSMVIAGSILPSTRSGQEGELRAVAIVVQGPKGNKTALVACDVLMMRRDMLDPAATKIEQICDIPSSHVLIHTTHTHHAPSTSTVHGYERDESFCRQVQEAIVEAVRRANERVGQSGPVTLHFRLGQEATVGQNSRLLLDDGMITWHRPEDVNLRPTGPFDPDLPVVAFRAADGGLEAMIFNHSTHTIGALAVRKRSPAFYGLAAQQIEEELGGTVMFLEGASGSTHNWRLRPPEALARIKNAVLDALSKTEPLAGDGVAALKREITIRVRDFDEQAEEKAVTSYCDTHIGKRAEPYVAVFRNMRQQLAPLQGQERKSWVQVVRIGDVAIVGVPGEFFTSLGVEIKRRSPFRYTYVAELSNDWIGYIADAPAYDLGGYQLWTGLHSWVARGTGEQIVDETVEMLDQLHAEWAGEN